MLSPRLLQIPFSLWWKEFTKGTREQRLGRSNSSTQVCCCYWSFAFAATSFMSFTAHDQFTKHHAISYINCGVRHFDGLTWQYLHATCDSDDFNTPVNISRHSPGGQYAERSDCRPSMYRYHAWTSAEQRSPCQHTVHATLTQNWTCTDRLQPMPTYFLVIRTRPLTTQSYRLW